MRADPAADASKLNLTNDVPLQKAALVASSCFVLF